MTTDTLSPGERVNVRYEGPGEYVGPDPDSNGLLVTVDHDGLTVSCAEEQVTPVREIGPSDPDHPIHFTVKVGNEDGDGSYLIEWRVWARTSAEGAKLATALLRTKATQAEGMAQARARAGQDAAFRKAATR